MNRLTILIAAGTVALTTGFVLADSHEADPMAGIERSKMNMDSMSPAVQRRMVAVDTMMEGTSIESSGHPDADFLMMMVPHQQSAVDMARVVLKEDYGQTTETIGQKVIGAHEAESTGMTAMLDGMDK